MVTPTWQCQVEHNNLMHRRAAVADIYVLLFGSGPFLLFSRLLLVVADLSAALWPPIGWVGPVSFNELKWTHMGPGPYWPRVHIVLSGEVVSRSGGFQQL
jgi:hypothetical protein